MKIQRQTVSIYPKYLAMRVLGDSIFLSKLLLKAINSKLLRGFKNSLGRKIDSLKHALPSILDIMLFGLMGLFITACTPPSTTSAVEQAKPETALALNNYSQTADEYLTQAQLSDGPNKQDLELKAAGRLFQDSMYQRAQQVLQEVSRNELSAELQNEFTLLSSRLAVSQHKPQKSLKMLADINEPALLNDMQRINYYSLLAAAYAQKNNYLESAEERLKLEPLLRGTSNRHTNQQQIWRSLEHVAKATLYSASLESKNSTLTAWLQLAYLVKNNANNPIELRNNLGQWLQDHSNHPAKVFAQQSLNQIASVDVTHKKRIALLLPLTGPLSGPGKAIREGFMAKYYESASRDAASVKVYDSAASSDVTMLYQQAVAEGADMIIGPLDKRRVGQLAQNAGGRVPVLALNYSTESYLPGNFYEFGLSPRDEAKQVATRAWERGLRRAVVITPKGSWGDGISGAFKTTWQQLGGKIVGQVSYAGKQQMTRQIRDILQISTSHKRDNDLKKILGNKVKFIPRRRKDIDMVFLSASPTKARQIRPLLSFYYAGKLPVYATSLVYSGRPSPNRDRDLNDVIFCDIPWVLQNKQISGNTSGRYNRLYALGSDAYVISQRTSQLNNFPSMGMNLNTGRISLQGDRRITRQLNWAQFKHGKPQPIS